MNSGIFITFEGGDGAGKSTQIRLAKEYIESRGYEVVLTREPGGTQIGEKIRDILLDRENSAMDPMTEAMLYAASRAQHVREVIIPALEAGKVVISDRFIDSSFAYQAYARGLGESVFVINSYAIGDYLPDATFLLKVDPAIGKKRLVPGQEDRIELEKLDFHQKVYDGYCRLEKMYPDRIIGIEAERPIDEISSVIQESLERLLNDI